MTITFDLDIDDMMAFQKHYLLNDRQFKHVTLFLTFLLPIVLLGLFLYKLAEKGINPGMIGMGLFLAIISIAWMLMLGKIFRKRTLARIRKALLKNDKDNSMIFGVREMTFDENGIATKTPKSESLVQWLGILKVEKTVNYYYLYLSNMNAFVIPIQKIGDSKNELDTIISKHVANIFHLN